MTNLLGLIKTQINQKQNLTARALIICLVNYQYLRYCLDSPGESYLQFMSLHINRHIP